MDYQAIYRERADEYDRLVSAEDADGNLAAALGRIAPLGGARVLDVGAGTGRIGRLVEAAGARVVGLDAAPAMLAVARRRTSATLLCADARSLPLAAGWANLAIAGWVFGHLRQWLEHGWRDAIGRALAEMERCLAPAGTLVVMETLGTGAQRAAPPDERLTEYYRWLERERGLARVEIRTDYLFGSAEEAAAAMTFFFGDALASTIRQERWARVPEHTGVWWRTAGRR